jgi:hypothetical protein
MVILRYYDGVYTLEWRGDNNIDENDEAMASLAGKPKLGAQITDVAQATEAVKWWNEFFGFGSTVATVYGNK